MQESCEQTTIVLAERPQPRGEGFENWADKPFYFGQLLFDDIGRTFLSVECEEVSLQCDIREPGDKPPSAARVEDLNSAVASGPGFQVTLWHQVVPL